jgi:hypothetical protein
VYAYVLRGNHYHLLLETPEANLVAGMQWVQFMGLCAMEQGEGTGAQGRPPMSII